MSLELNKSAAAVLTAGIVAMTAGFVANLLVHPQQLEQNVYVVEGTGGTAQTEAAQEEEQLEPVLPLLAEADTANGESLSRACQACHTFEQGGANKVGPNLWNVVGSDIATTEGFNFSDALTGLEGEWTYEKLNAYLSDPRGYAPGTRMTYGGMRDVEDRADMIAWLRSLSDSPQALPTEEEIQEVQQAEENGAEEGGEAAEGEDGEEAADEEGASGAEGESGGEGTDSEEGGSESGASGEDSSSEGGQESGGSGAESQGDEQNGEGEGEGEGDETPPQ